MRKIISLMLMMTLSLPALTACTASADQRTGEAEGSVNAANILKPALSRGEATTELQGRIYHIMQGMVGVHPGDPTYLVNPDVATYQKTM